jgi:putative ABC transport system permease protein
MYIPWLQEGQYLNGMGSNVGYMTVVARAKCAPSTASCNAAALVPAIRGVVWSFNPDLPVTQVQTMDEVIDAANAQPRFNLVLLAAFASIALVLAAVGVYGVMSYAVSRRTHEIGVRMALGAKPADVVRLVVRQGMSVALVGGAVGVVGALALTRLMTRLLYGVAPSDPATFAAVSGILVLVALVGSYLPARNAARVDPLLALRGE